MKRILLVLLCLILVSFAKTNLAKSSKSILITNKSELNINGTSNVSDFKCVYNIKNLGHPIRIHYEKDNDVIRFENSILVLENSGFDCGGKVINRDFHGLLQSDIYPEIILRLKEVRVKHHKKNTADAIVEIEIAGIKNSYHMEIQFKNEQDWHIAGQLKLNINKFNLKAPKKMLGLIVVSDEIEISFKLVIKEC
ncbi:MAG: YceI family protein [Gelidibacter sp.]